MNRRVSFLSILLALAMRMLRRRTAASLFGLLLISGSIAAVPAIPVVSWAGAGMTVSGRISNKNDEPQKGYDGIRHLRLHLVRRSAKASGGGAALTELANTKVCIATVLSNAANRLTIERR